jgi:sugar phosphate isomerase/epimerase
MVKKVIKLASLLLVLTACAFANDLASICFDEQFSFWQPDHGEWQSVGGAFMDAGQPTRLGVLPGQGVVVNGMNGNTHHLVSCDEFGDIRLHIEFMVPEESNSGVYFMGRYEIQVRDSFKKESHYAGNECGGIYQRWDESREPKGFEGVSPRIDAARAPGQWQWFDVVFRAPRFDESGKKIRNACFEKVYHNGFLVHENVEVRGPTRASLFDDEKPLGPLMLQGDHGPVAFRNLRVFPADQPFFFAMDTGVKDDQHLTFEQQADMLRELGYDGMDHTSVENLPEKFSALDRHSLRLFAVYLDVLVDRDQQTYNDGLEQAVELLKGRDVTLWVPLRSDDFQPSDAAGDESAVRVIRRIADLAESAGLQVALYPHSFFMMGKISDALRIAKKVNRSNVGVTFNLCHWLRTDRRDLNETLTEAAPYLRMVTINGADNQGEWKELIQPLGSGEFEVSSALTALKKIGYAGTIGLQGYGIGGDVHENLRRSMAAWQALQNR